MTALTMERIENWKRWIVRHSGMDSQRVIELCDICDLALLGLAQEQNPLSQAPLSSESTGPNAPETGQGEKPAAAATLAEANACYLKYFDLYTASQKDIAAKQALIDKLMLEFCPEEMTPKQLAEWGKHQRVAHEPAAEAPDRPTPRTDEIALRLTGREGLFCDDDSLEQYNDLLRLARQLERELAEAKAKIARMRPSEEAVLLAETNIGLGIGHIADREILRINEEAK